MAFQKVITVFLRVILEQDASSIKTANEKAMFLNNFLIIHLTAERYLKAYSHKCAGSIPQELRFEEFQKPEIQN